ncbi:MAG TPA: hypothetical protein GXX53_09580 [Tissierellia bacterium]|nr:hypothetical protein [Tissierellia bacterium]
MIGALLNVIGIICIIISLIILNRTTKNEKNIYEDMLSKYSDIKYYYEYLDNILNDFNEIVNKGISRVESLNISEPELTYNNGNEEMKNEYSNKDLATMITIEESNNDNEIMQKIIELKKQGMSEKEIAKLLNRGIREVEIIIKMLENI